MTDDTDTMLSARVSVHGMMRRVTGGYEVTRMEDGKPMERRTFSDRSHALTFLVLGDRTPVIAEA